MCKESCNMEYQDIIVCSFFQSQAEESYCIGKSEETYHKSSFAVAAFEAGLMVSHPISWQQINKVNSLVTSLAFIKSSGERHDFQPFSETKKSFWIMQNAEGIWLARNLYSEKSERGREDLTRSVLFRIFSRFLDLDCWSVWTKSLIFQMKN